MTRDAAAIAAEIILNWNGEWFGELEADIAAAIEQDRAEREAWLPIESAPRDGTPILLALEYASNFYRYVARWHSELGCWSRDETGSAIFPKHMQGWFTHYRPLPSPPSEEPSS